jgi:hypothetical protein
MSFKSALLGATLAVGIVGSGAAMADTLTQTFGTGLQPIDLTGTNPLALGLFDPSLGTLTGVSFDVTVEQVAGGTFTSMASAPTNFTIMQNVQFSVTDGGLLSPYLSGLNASSTVSESYNNVAPNQSEAFGPFDALSSSFRLAGAPLALFVGPGTDNIFVSTVTFDGETGGSAAYNFNTQADATFQVTYTYTGAAPDNVPLPALAGTLPGMLIALGALVRRRRHA